MAQIIINRKNFVGGNIHIGNGKVIIDGKDVTSEYNSEEKEINITVTGDIQSLEVDSCNKVLVTGNTGPVKTVSGDVDITGDVAGSVNTVSGDVDCGNIAGSVRTVSGDIKHRR